jgi:hypothetical protein
MKKLKVLLVTSMPWREDNNIGNSYSNIFGDLDNVEFAHIYCRSGMPQNKIVHKYFQITEGSLIKNLLNSKKPTGKEVFVSKNESKNKESNSKVYDKMRILRWEVFFLARDIIWNLGRWKTKELDEFVEEFNPDVIFGTLTYMPNINKLMVYLKEKLQKPMIIYSWDDVYSLNQSSFSPIFWFRKFIQRKHIRNCVKRCEFLYTITAQMQKEYAQYFNKECKMLYKGYDFITPAASKGKITLPLKFIFMGNIGAGRWQTLSKLASTIHLLNAKNDRQVAVLDIYTLSPKSKDMIEKLSIEGASNLRDVVATSEVMAVQQSADVLVHVEPTTKSERLFYRLSFSTKIVDYFYNSRCILGIGGKTATLDYLKDQDAGIVVYDLNDLEKSVLNLVENPEIINKYANKAWDCGQRNHQRSELKKMLLDDFLNVKQKYENTTN